MKPTVKQAMENLILEARAKMPFNRSFDGHCEGRCDECPEKRLEFLDIDLSDWGSRLARGETPALRDLEGLAGHCKEVYTILQKRGLVPPPDTNKTST